MSTGERFAELLSRLARAVTNRQASEVCCGDLTLEQFQTLRAIDGADGPSIGSLSLELGVDLSTMSRNISLLEKNGHLTRARSAEDGRVVQVKLTAKGRRSLETLRCGERDVLGDIYESVPAADRPRIVKALETLNECVAGSAPGAACCAPSAPRKTTS